MHFGPPGFLIGFVSRPKPQAELVNGEAGDKPVMNNQTEKNPPAVTPAPEVSLKWKDITQLLKQKLTSQAFEKTLGYAPRVSSRKTTLCRHTVGEARRYDA